MNVKDLGFTFLHLGINQENKEEAKKTAELMTTLFGFEQRKTSASIFLNEQFEVMEMPFRGTLGHIALGTKNAQEARKWLESKGISFDETTAKYDDNGKLIFIYANDEIAGFAFHINQI